MSNNIYRILRKEIYFTMIMVVDSRDINEYDG